MSRRKRALIDFAIYFGAVMLLDYAGAAWWASIVLVPVAIWNFWDGMTRSEMRDREWRSRNGIERRA